MTDVVEEHMHVRLGVEDDHLLEGELLDDPSTYELPWRAKIGYAHGHIMNDLCAGVWFTYLLIFLKNVAFLQQGQAGK